MVLSISVKVAEKLNLLFENTNIESIGILRRNLELKYEIGAEDNPSSESSSTSFQNSSGD